MGLDHNDKRAQNFTSGAILDRNLKKVVIPAGKNAELLEGIYAIVEAGVKDIYGDPTQKKYQKIVNLIIKRVSDTLKDTNISSDLTELSSELNKSIPELKKKIEIEEKTSTKKSDATEKRLLLFLDNIKNSILEFRKQQQSELTQLKTQLRDIVDKDSDKKEDKDKDKKEDKDSSEVIEVEKKTNEKATENTDKSENRILSTISNVISELKNNVELGLNSLTNSFGDMRLVLTNSFASFGSNFSQIQLQLNSQIQANTEGFSDVNNQIDAINENVQIALETTANTLDSISIGTKFDAIQETIIQNFEHQGQIVNSLKNSTLNAIRVSSKTQSKAVESAKTSFMTNVSIFMKRTRNVLTRKIQFIGALTNKWGKKNNQSVEALHESLPRKIWNGVKAIVSTLLEPIKWVGNLAANILKQMLKPFMWLIDLIKGPALILLFAAALIYIWPYISDYVTTLWTDYISPALNKIWKLVKKAWEVVYPVVKQWWIDTWSPWGGFLGFVDKVVLPKIVLFWDNYVWPFLRGPVWEFVKRHWKGLLITLGIWAFLKDPLRMIGVLFKTPIALLKIIQGTLAVLKFTVKGIDKITGGFVSKLVSVLPAAMIPMLIIAVAKLLADWWQSKEDDRILAEIEDLERQQEKVDREAEKNDKELRRLLLNTDSNMGFAIAALTVIDQTTTELLKNANIKKKVKLFELKLPNGQIKYTTSDKLSETLSQEMKLMRGDEKNARTFEGMRHRLAHSDDEYYFGWDKETSDALKEMRSQWRKQRKIKGIGSITGGQAVDWHTTLTEMVNADSAAKSLFLEINYMVEKALKIGRTFAESLAWDENANTDILSVGVKNFMDKLQEIKDNAYNEVSKALNAGVSRYGRTYTMSFSTSELDTLRTQTAQKIGDILAEFYNTGIKDSVETVRRKSKAYKEIGLTGVIKGNGAFRRTEYEYHDPIWDKFNKHQARPTRYVNKKTSDQGMYGWNMVGADPIKTSGPWITENQVDAQSARISNMQEFNDMMAQLSTPAITSQLVRDQIKDLEAKTKIVLDDLVKKYNLKSNFNTQADKDIQAKFKAFYQQALIAKGGNLTPEDKIQIKAAFLQQLADDLTHVDNPLENARYRNYIQAFAKAFKAEKDQLEQTSRDDWIKSRDARLQSIWKNMNIIEQSRYNGFEDFVKKTQERSDQIISTYIQQSFYNVKDDVDSITDAGKRPQ